MKQLMVSLLTLGTTLAWKRLLDSVFDAGHGGVPDRKPARELGALGLVNVAPFAGQEGCVRLGRTRER